MKRTTLAIVAAAALMGAGASYAQQPPPPPGAEDHAGMQMQRPDPAQMAERHAQHLRDVLQLRPDQEPALRALIDALRPPEGQREKMRRDFAEARNLTTPQRLDRMRDRMAERQAKFERHAAAIKRFYAQLSPAQQKAFDAMPMMGMGHRGGHRGMGGKGHGGMGGHGMGPGGPGMDGHGMDGHGMDGHGPN